MCLGQLACAQKVMFKPVGLADRLHLLSRLPRNAYSLTNRMRLFPTHLAIHRSSYTTIFEHEAHLESIADNLHGCAKTGKTIHRTHCLTNYHQQTHTLENKKPSPFWRKTDHNRKAIARIKQSVKYRLTLESKREIPVNEGIHQQITDAL